DGPLSNASPVWIHIGYNNFTDTFATNMTDIGNGQWQYDYAIPTNAMDVEFVFRNAADTIYDNNSGMDWTVNVAGCVASTQLFLMDGLFDSDHYEVANTGMKILAAVKGQNLYAATWSANGGGSDHFLYVTDQFGGPDGTPWGKAGVVYFDTATKPYLASESAPADGYNTFNSAGINGRSTMGTGGNALEGELNLIEVFGQIPEVLYMAAIAYGDNDGEGINAQVPATWDNNDNIEVMEFVPVPVASIRDDNCDGYLDGGRPVLQSVVNNDTNDANYNIRRFYIDETIGDREFLGFVFAANVAPTDVVTEVELISNLNRRDFAQLDFDLDLATVNHPTNYFQAWPMADKGDGTWSVTLPVEKTGAYRATVRYRVNGRRYYYTDSGLRRDLAIVVSPKKVLCRTLYELNPMVTEATDSTFFGRSTLKDMYLTNTNKPNAVDTAYFSNLGINTIWLQPIHPIGSDNRQTDPETGLPFDPGSPFAIRDFWAVNPVLGDPANENQAMTEFRDFVAEMDAIGVDIMLDAPFNHSAWDCEIGAMGTNLFPWATNQTEFIRDIRPQWYSKNTDYGERASYYNTSSDTDIAPAPDRSDFGKWDDVADFNFGRYAALVQRQTAAWRDQFLSERDAFEGHDVYSREIWEYFARYAEYWLEQTGHPKGTSKFDSYKGIDGFRCDFAQGMPSVFWEYLINKSRSVKWDLYFMAESLDGFREVGGSKRHGLSFRSARHFDIMNENILFYWRDEFFAYPSGSPNPTTSPTFNAFNDRREAYDNVVLLNNLTSHDETFPTDNPYRMLYAYAEVAAMDGIPMIFYGQEAGARNDFTTYPGVPNGDHNWDKYELNFGKSIPNFKRYNHMRNVWDNEDAFLRGVYSRINRAKLGSAALKSQQNYFLGQLGGGGFDERIFAVARFEEPGISAATQDVVFVFVNNDHVSNPTVAQTYDVDVDLSPGVNW
ncbi:MAG: hypothetical protein AAF492_06280, partial [Verrucomicrobiota bacterium]